MKTITLVEAHSVYGIKTHAAFVEANGPQITEALSQHSFKMLPQVLAALKAMVEDMVEGPFFHEDENDHPDCALQKAREAIKAAESVVVP